MIEKGGILVILNMIEEESVWAFLDHLAQIFMLPAVLYAGRYAKKTYDTQNDELKTEQAFIKKQLKQTEVENFIKSFEFVHSSKGFFSITDKDNDEIFKFQIDFY